MIRKNSLLCKIFHAKISSENIFNAYMKQFRPERETCPICGSKGSCHIHDYYSRSLIDYHAGNRIKSSLCILRVYCDSCCHAHAILPDVIIPYASFSLQFILYVLGDFFARHLTIEQICEKYGVTSNQFYKWLRLWHAHKRQWLGLLEDIETTNLTFMEYLVLLESYSLFSMNFIRVTLDLTGWQYLQICHQGICIIPLHQQLTWQECFF